VCAVAYSVLSAHAICSSVKPPGPISRRTAPGRVPASADSTATGSCAATAETSSRSETCDVLRSLLKNATRISSLGDCRDCATEGQLQRQAKTVKRLGGSGWRKLLRSHPLETAGTAQRVTHSRQAGSGREKVDNSGRTSAKQQLYIQG
jgi:hypothetical protein